MLNALTRDAIRRWAQGNRSTAWLEQTLRDRVTVILRGIGDGIAMGGDRSAEPFSSVRSRRSAQSSAP